MDADNVVQLVTAGFGVGGTLAAAILTQALGSSSERKRNAREDKARWLTERLEVNSAFLREAISLERKLWGTCAFLDRDDREVRLAGYTSIVMVPDGGIDGVLDAEAHQIMLEDHRAAMEALERLEELSAKITLIGTFEEGESSRELWEALALVGGLLESYAPFDRAADAVEGCRAARDDFAAAARFSLQVEGAYPPPDSRPRLRS